MAEGIQASHMPSEASPDLHKKDAQDTGSPQPVSLVSTRLTRDVITEIIQCHPDEGVRWQVRIDGLEGRLSEERVDWRVG